MAEQFEGTRAQMQRISDAVDVARGLPRKERLRGATGRVTIPDTPGPGWTLRHVNVEEHPATRRDRDAPEAARVFAYPVTPEVLALHGRVVQVEGQDVTIDTSARVTRGEDWDAAPSRG